MPIQIDPSSDKRSKDIHHSKKHYRGVKAAYIENQTSIKRLEMKMSRLRRTIDAAEARKKSLELLIESEDLMLARIQEVNAQGYHTEFDKVYMDKLYEDKEAVEKLLKEKECRNQS